MTRTPLWAHFSKIFLGEMHLSIILDLLTLQMGSMTLKFKTSLHIANEETKHMQHLSENIMAVFFGRPTWLVYFSTLARHSPLELQQLRAAVF